MLPGIHTIGVRVLGHDVLDVVFAALAEQIDDTLIALFALRGNSAVRVLFGVSDEVELRS